jgi:hypothetical protein
MQAGSATAVQLGALSGVPRTSVYPVLKELESKRLVSQTPGKAALWVSPGEDEVLDRLYAEQRERFEGLKQRVESARQTLAQIGLGPGASLPYVQIIPSAAQSKLAFEQSLASTSSELLMFTRPPWSWPKGTGNETVMGMLQRGVKARALYQGSDLRSPENDASRAELESYHAAGTEARVLEDLPMKLAIFDRQIALFALSDPVPTDVGFPTALLVEHAGFAAMQARAFDDLWSTADPYDEFMAGPAGRRGDG